MVLAILFWAYVRVSQAGGLGTQSMALITVTVPLIPQKVEPDLLCYYLSSDTVKVTLRGAPVTVSALAEAQVKASVDLSGMAAGSQWPEVKALAPGGLELISIEPKSVNVKLSPSGTKLVGVKVLVSGKPGPGFEAGEPVVDPAQVKLTGPEAMLQEVEAAQGRVVLEGQTNNLAADLSDLSPVNSDGTTVRTQQYRLRVNPSTVGVTIPVLGKSRSVAVPVSLDHIQLLPALNWRYRVEVEPELITLRVPREMEPPTALLTRFSLFESLHRTESRQVDLEIPDGVAVVGSSTVRVRVIPERIVIPEPTHSTTPGTPTPTP